MLFSLPATPLIFHFFFFNDTATTEIYTLSLHDALPICLCDWPNNRERISDRWWKNRLILWSVSSICPMRDRKSTRLNSSHQIISYAVFCLKKKTTKNQYNIC